MNFQQRSKWPSSILLYTLTRVFITRPKPAYGRQDLLELDLRPLGKVIIFRYRQTDRQTDTHHNIYISIISIIHIIFIIIILTIVLITIKDRAKDMYNDDDESLCKRLHDLHHGHDFSFLSNKFGKCARLVLHGNPPQN